MFSVAEACKSSTGDGASVRVARFLVQLAGVIDGDDVLDIAASAFGVGQHLPVDDARFEPTLSLIPRGSSSGKVRAVFTSGDGAAPSLHEAAAWPAKVGSITPYREREAGNLLVRRGAVTRIEWPVSAVAPECRR